MAYSIAELLAVQVVETIKKVSEPGGYTKTLIVRQDAEELQRIRDGLCVVEFGDPEPIEDSPTSKDDYYLPVTVKVFRTQSSASGGTIRELLNDSVADIIRAVGTNPTFGGLAVYELWDQPQSVDLPPGGVQGKSVGFRVFFRTAKDNPFSQ